MKERREVIIMDLGEIKSCNKGRLIRVAVNGITRRINPE